MCFDSFPQECSGKIITTTNDHVIIRFKDDGIHVLEVVAIWMMDFYEDLSTILFVNLTWLASMSLEGIAEEVQNAAQPFHDLAGHQVKKWKRTYCLIMNFVEEIDQFFGMFLLISFVKLYVTFFLFSFSAVVYMFTSKKRLVFMIVYLIKNLVLMSVVIFASEQMRRKVSLKTFRPKKCAKKQLFTC